MKKVHFSPFHRLTGSTLQAENSFGLNSLILVPQARNMIELQTGRNEISCWGKVGEDWEDKMSKYVATAVKERREI